MFKFSNKSLRRLATVHADLQKVVNRALEISEIDFSVLEGRRTLERQFYLRKRGRSQTMKSQHLLGRAVDLVPYPVDWNDKDAFSKVADAMKRAAAELGIEIEWGGDWKTFIDMPHFQLKPKGRNDERA